MRLSYGLVCAVTEKTRVEHYLGLAHEAERLAANAKDAEAIAHLAKTAAGL